MTALLEFAKNYYIFMLLLFMFSYLVPKNVYKKYARFMVGVVMVLLLIQPIHKWINEEDSVLLFEQKIKEEMEAFDFQHEMPVFIREGEDVYERYEAFAKENKGVFKDTDEDGLSGTSVYRNIGDGGDDTDGKKE